MVEISAIKVELELEFFKENFGNIVITILPLIIFTVKLLVNWFFYVLMHHYHFSMVTKLLIVYLIWKPGAIPRPHIFGR